MEKIQLRIKTVKAISVVKINFANSRNEFLNNASTEDILLKIHAANKYISKKYKSEAINVCSFNMFRRLIKYSFQTFFLFDTIE